MHVTGRGITEGDSISKADIEMVTSAPSPLFPSSPAAAWPMQTCLAGHQTLSRGCRVQYLGIGGRGEGKDRDGRMGRKVW